MRNYKFESYVPEEKFHQGKDARFWRAAFEDCFVVNFHYNNADVLASCRGTKLPEFSTADTAALLNLFNGSKEFLVLSSSDGTLLIHPTWPHLEMGLAFLLKESAADVKKAYQNAQRCAFSSFLNGETEAKNDLENKLCTLNFYMECLFGTKRETNVTAHVLMIASLVGCHLCKTSVLQVNDTIDKREIERLDAYLFCTFMTMRRYNGKVTALPAEEQKTASNLIHVMQEYGLRIQQSVRKQVRGEEPFDVSIDSVYKSFSTLPVFKDYKIEEAEDTLCLHIPLKQKALLSSIAAIGTTKEITLTLFPLF